jgi:hypothetical protein
MALSILDGNQSATTLSTILSSGQHITAHTVVSLGTQAKTDILAAVSSGIAISGTVTAMAGANFSDEISQGILNFQENEDGFDIGSLPAITGTVTASNLPLVSAIEAGRVQAVPVYLSGFADGANIDDINRVLSIPSIPAGTNQIGTVTANSSNGSLTTRFGSVTTANTAFATSAVTNENRKYLLIQNITTASNAITVGIGFTPTTTQGILLSSGAGITFEGNYIPTGAVNLLSSVTASCFTILEA